MTTLIVGGGSQTGVALARYLREAHNEVLFASRSGRVPDGSKVVKFDWFDPSTFEAPFIADSSIQCVYLVPPPTELEPLPVVRPFIDLAVKKGVKRFVLLSGSAFKEKGPGAVYAAKIHTYLDEEGLDYVALRPSVFLENLVWYLSYGIRENDALETIIPTARIPFVGVEDIARVAFDAITNPTALPSNEPIINGPEYLTYNQIADILSSVLGRPITHNTIAKEDLVQKHFIRSGVPEDFARLLADLHEAYENKYEEQYISDPRVVLGKVSARDWIERNKGAFEKARQD